MATTLQTLDDGEFWLPPQFLDDDDDVFVEKKFNDGFNNTKPSFSAFDFPYGFNTSGLNSPVESTLGSSTDSDEEDILLSVLTQKLAHSTLEENFPSLHKTSKPELSTSPQSTLYGSGCGCKHGNPNGDSEGATWDLLYAAAGEVARIRMSQQLHACYNNTRNEHFGYFAPSREQSPISPPLNNNSSNTHSPNLALYHKLQASQFHHLRRQQMMKRQQQYQSHPPVAHSRVSRPNTVGNAYTPLIRSQTGSDMRPVFLGNPQTKRDCAGTGVFIPRRVGTPTEPRKKQAAACSTVLLPAKVSLKMEDAGPTSVPQPHQPRFNNGEKRVTKPQQVINLPSEWIY